MQLFGVGAFEAVLVLIVTLIVVGPHRFPEVARQAGRWYKVARRFSAEVTKDVRAAISEIEDEVRADGDDLRSIRELTEELQQDLRSSAQDIENTTRETTAELNAGDETARRNGAGSTASGATAAGAAARNGAGSTNRTSSAKPAAKPARGASSASITTGDAAKVEPPAAKPAAEPAPAATSANGTAEDEPASEAATPDLEHEPEVVAKPKPAPKRPSSVFERELDPFERLEQRQREQRAAAGNGASEDTAEAGSDN